MSRTIIAPEDGYLPRVADSLLDRTLRASGAVLVKGPKWCGKTMTCERHSASQVFLQDPDRGDDLVALAETKPSLLLKGPEPRLIDEWQMAPKIWDAVRFALDREHGKGRFILTGSATPTVEPAHTGVGRIARVAMRTMSLLESRESTGEISLKGLFAGNGFDGALASMGIEDYAFAICRGGWPEAVLQDDETISLDMARLYVDELLGSDIARMDSMRRNSTWLREIMASYARNTSTEASLATIARDMAGDPPSAPTVSEYVDALARACVTEDLRAWNPRLRSKTKVRTSPVRHFCDPSIAASMLGLSPETLLFSWSTFGLLFESLCVRDLRVYADALGGHVYHYRDKTGLEADAVMVLRDGRWAPIEVKLGEKYVDEAAKHLQELANRVDHTNMGAPSFLMILTAGAAAYQREDGVYIVPLGVLGP